jgi:hypothetical protein
MNNNNNNNGHLDRRVQVPELEHQESTILASLVVDVMKPPARGVSNRLGEYINCLRSQTSLSDVASRTSMGSIVDRSIAEDGVDR